MSRLKMKSREAGVREETAAFHRLKVADSVPMSSPNARNVSLNLLPQHKEINHMKMSSFHDV